MHPRFFIFYGGTVSAQVLLPHGPVYLPLGVPLGHGVPLVVILLALAQAQLHLDAGVLEVDGQGDEGVSVLLLQVVELAYLAALIQSKPISLRDFPLSVQKQNWNTQLT